MSISTQITRLQTIRNAIREALISWGVITNSAADFEDCQTAIESIKNRGEIAVTLDTVTKSKTIDSGYYKGGSVSIVTQEKTATANGEITPDAGKVLSKVTVNVSSEAPILQEKSVTPTKSVQEITNDEGYDGLSKVTVGAIPAAYQDVTGVTAEARDVLANKVFVDSTGATVPGTMQNNGTVEAKINGLTVTSYTVPGGYHSGDGTVSLTDDIETALAAL